MLAIQVTVHDLISQIASFIGMMRRLSPLLEVLLRQILLLTIYRKLLFRANFKLETLVMVLSPTMGGTFLWMSLRLLL